MAAPNNWQFAVEVYPPDWRFPAGKTWLAGWIYMGADRYATDLRAWVGNRPFLGLYGQPKPGLDEQFIGRSGPPYAGFTFRVEPHRTATLLRLEVRNPAGIWQEFFRTPITVANDAPAQPEFSTLNSRLGKLVPDILRMRCQRPTASFSALANEVMASAIAEPLNSLPNPPFHGALEEPLITGRMRYGRLAVTGWLAHVTEKIKRITALTDAVQECTLLHGLPRKDVSGTFADLPDGEHSAFVGQVDLPANQSTPALIKIFAELENGEKHLVFAQRFTPHVIAGPDIPLPPASKTQFTRAVWALRNSALHHGLKIGPLNEFLSATKAEWTAYRQAAPIRIHHHSSRLNPAHQVTDASPLRLLVVTHNLNFEGAPRLIFELSRHLGRQPGNTVRILSPHEGPMRTLFEEAGMPVEVVDLSSAMAADSPREFHHALARAVSIDWSQIDLVVANTMVSFWAIHMATLSEKPSIFYVHESAPIGRFFHDMLPTALLPLVESAFRDSTRVVFTADSSRGIFSSLEKSGNFRVKPSWLDVTAIDRFVAAHPKEALRAKHGIDPNAVVLLNLGTICERKGQHTFIRAAALLESELQAKYPDHPVEFVMVGDRVDQFSTLLRIQTADAGLKQVRFVRETRENFDWLRLADILVCTSFEESSPRVLLEAASFNLPIVSTDVNGIPELVTAEEARLVKPGDPYQLAVGLRLALAAFNAGDTTLPDRARRTVTSRFDESVSLPQHHALAIEAVGSFT